MIRKRNGFTLAELLIVIVILGILGGIALPRFYPQQEKARVAEAVTMLSAIRMGEAAYRLEKGVYRDATAGTAVADDLLWESLGIENPNDDENRSFDYKVDITDAPSFTATATRKDANVKTITLCQAGCWGGTHSYAPSNPEGTCA